MAKKALVVFGPHNPSKVSEFDMVVSGDKLEALTQAGSIHKATALTEEISKLTLPNGKLIPKSFTYQGYELWWMHYTDLFLYYALPYLQYQKLLEQLREFEHVTFYDPPYGNLFSLYLQAYGVRVEIISKDKFRIPFGITLQILLTIICLPALVLMQKRHLIFIGDKFEKGQDYDFRMKFIYEELRKKNLSYVEFIRSIDSSKVTITHALKRMRPVIYYQAISMLGKFLSIVSGDRDKAEREFGSHLFTNEHDPLRKFKLLVGTQPMLSIYADVWGIRVMKWVLWVIGVKSAFIPAATERNFHTVIAAKLNKIPTVGILHGVASRFYNHYDFLPGFEGEKSLSVDEYGLWSKWWKEYYVANSRAYKPEQLIVSGPMRPVESMSNSTSHYSGPIRVLFIAEKTRTPHESLLYLKELLKHDDLKVMIKFRPFRDSFETWLLENEPNILRLGNIEIVKGDMQSAIANADVAVAAHSTGALEALLQYKIPIFFYTEEWGDYYDMKSSPELHRFYAENASELVLRIRDSQTIPREGVVKLREQYFGDPERNGSAWVVRRLEELV